MVRMRVGLVVAVIACLAALASPGAAEEDLDISTTPDMDLGADPAGADDDLTLETDGKTIAGGTRFRFAPVDDPEASIADTVYWRGIPGVVAACTTLVTVEVDGSAVIAPSRSLSDAKVADTELTYPIEGRMPLDEGDHTISPGGIRFRIHHNEVTSDHPALAIGDDEIAILCAPIRFDAAAATGALIPVPVSVRIGEQSLLRAEAAFAPLIVWLPVGLAYETSFGTFSITAEGALKPDRLAAGVTAVAGGLRMSAAQASSARAPAAAADPEIVTAGGLRLFVPTRVEPDGDLPVACDKNEFEAAAQVPWTPGALSFSGPSLGGPPSPFPSTTPTIPAELAQRAATKLGVDVDDLGWSAMRLPKGATGAFAFTVARSGASIQHAVLVSAAVKPFCVVPYRMRTAFEQSERQVYQVLMPDGFAGGAATIRCAAKDVTDGAAMELGRMTLPAVAGVPFDARLFEVDMADLPPGDYRLWVESASASTAPITLSVLPAWLPRSSFFLTTMSCCVGPPPEDDAGLAALRAAGIEMTTAVGHWGRLGINLPVQDGQVATALAAQAPALPVELALRPEYNDQLLDRMLRHRVRIVDEIVARGNSFYLEGLSYHHSYQPSVDRNVRRMQIFAQHTADFPSWMGGNASWFPTWWGYVEGGVPTDAHTKDRNEALAAACAAAGLIEPTAEERAWYDANMTSDDDDTRAKADALRRRGVEFWKGREALAFAKHNRIYNRAIREVRPGTTCLLFENAGHDGGKSTTAMFTDMDAACYESYTDYGEWPMSAGWTTDNARGNCPGQPVWITVDWGSSPEGQLKSLATVFARGARGGAPPLPADAGPSHLARMGTGLQFLAQYGAIATHAVPDQRIAVLRAHGLKGSQYWECHALWYHLARLGCAPAVLTDDVVIAAGIPKHVELVCIPQQPEPLDPRILSAIATFQKSGGKVLEIAGDPAPIAGAIALDLKLPSLMEVGAFQQKSHQAMWRTFIETARAPLGAALAEAGIRPLIATDPERGLVFALDAGAVRYAVVLADAKDTRYADFTATEALPLTIAGAGWKARDLAKQIELVGSEQDGATTFSVDLITEPTTIVAFYRTAPAAVQVRCASAALGGELIVAADVLDRIGGAALGPVPVAMTVVDPAGAERDTVFRAAGDELRVPLAARDQVGTWRVRVQELLTGVTTTIDVAVTAPAAKPTATMIAEVHVVDQVRLRAFAAREREKLIIVEPGQQDRLPLAQRLVDAIVGAGGAARLWQVGYQDYDGIPLRWYPRPADQAQMSLVDQGKLIGFRIDLTPYIDRREFVQAHIPEKGGWSDIRPSYQVGGDCVVFSGGRLGDSLREVTLWMNTANVPGKGQGRLVTVLSPFVADRQCTAVVANDAAGFAAATATLVEILAAKRAPAVVATAPAATLAPVAGVSETNPVRRPYQGFTPVRRVQRLLANRSGAAVLGLSGKGDAVAFVDAQGAITATVTPAGGAKRYDRIDDQGALWHYVSTATAIDPSWHFPTDHRVIAQRILPDSSVGREVQVYDGDTNNIAPGWEFESCFAIGPDGATAALGRKAGLLLGTIGGEAWRTYDDLPHLRVNFEYRAPRFPVGLTFSPDSSHVLFTMDSRPAGFGPMNQSAWQPCAAETVLMETATGERVWSLRGDDHRASEYATFTGFAAVSTGGALSAFADVNGTCRIVDRSGTVVASIMAYPKPGMYHAPTPANGVGVWMDDDGALAAFGFRGRLLLAARGAFSAVTVDDLCSGCVAGDGTLAVIGEESGMVRAYAADGKPMWSFATHGVGALVAAVGEREFLVATSVGELIRLDGSGKELRRLDVVARTEQGTHPLAPPASPTTAQGPLEYREPDTLAVAKRRLAAAPITAWKPVGEGRAAFGRIFHPVKSEIALSAGAAKDCFLHLVYRRGDGNTALTVTTSGADGGETFTLDLPTPHYRVVDIPVRGPNARITVTTAGACEIADCSLWSMQWPGANMAYVDQGDASGDQFENLGGDEPDSDDAPLAAQELESGATTGVMKDCAVWWPNTSIDQVSGPWLKVKVPPLAVVDGKRFGNGALPAWAEANEKISNFRGAWFTIDFARPVALSLVATYDRARNQAQVSSAIALLDGPANKNANVEESRALTGVVANDQFWRLLELAEPAELRVVGVLSYNGGVTGLSEVEIYP